MSSAVKNALISVFSFLPVQDLVHAGQANRGWRDAAGATPLSTDFGRPESTQTYIVLVRHGETELNAQNKTQGAGEDPSLNEKGRRQAAILAHRFFRAYERLDSPLLAKTLYASNLKRTHETAEATRIRFKDKVVFTIQSDARLREMEWGVAEGMDNKAKKAKYPTADLFETSRKAWDTNPVPGAESATQVATRAREVVTEIAKRHLGEVVLVFTSGKLMRILAADVMGSEKLPPVLENGAAIHFLYTQNKDSSTLTCVKQVSLDGKLAVREPGKKS